MPAAMRLFNCDESIGALIMMSRPLWPALTATAGTAPTSGPDEKTFAVFQRSACTGMLEGNQLIFKLVDPSRSVLIFVFLRKKTKQNLRRRRRRSDPPFTPNPHLPQHKHFVCFPAERKRNNSRPTAGGAVHTPSAGLCSAEESGGRNIANRSSVDVSPLPLIPPGSM